jgi:hypothetical protein
MAKFTNKLSKDLSAGPEKYPQRNFKENGYEPARYEEFKPGEAERIVQQIIKREEKGKSCDV